MKREPRPRAAYSLPRYPRALGLVALAVLCDEAACCFLEHPVGRGHFADPNFVVPMQDPIRQQYEEKKSAAYAHNALDAGVCAGVPSDDESP